MVVENLHRGAQHQVAGARMTEKKKRKDLPFAPGPAISDFPLLSSGVFESSTRMIKFTIKKIREIDRSHAG